jgi:hypothetical protein
MFHRPGARLAYCNWDNLNVAERLLRLAFKAQPKAGSPWKPWAC